MTTSNAETTAVEKSKADGLVVARRRFWLVAACYAAWLAGLLAMAWFSAKKPRDRALPQRDEAKE